jgi:hypothetical protein
MVMIEVLPRLPVLLKGSTEMIPPLRPCDRTSRGQRRAGADASAGNRIERTDDRIVCGKL